MRNKSSRQTNPCGKLLRIIDISQILNIPFAAKELSFLFSITDSHTFLAVLLLSSSKATKYQKMF